MNKAQKPVSIVFLDRDGLPERIQIPTPNIAHQWVNYPATSADKIIERSKGTDILVVNKVKIDAGTLDACPTIKHIVVSATGYNIIDIQACESRGVSVSNIPSYAATTVSEHVIGSAIMLRREMNRYRQSVVDGDWQHAPAFCLFGKAFHNIRGATMGLIGLGEIGEATAERARAMGMKVLFCARSKRLHDYAEQVDLDQLLRRSDIVSLHCNLNDSTKGLIGDRELGLMQQHTILINTARGGIVDENAVVRAIKDEQIAGIAFDVMAEEPPANTAPLLSVANYANVLLTPHIAWASEQAMQYLADTVTHNIEAFISGSPINLVTNLKT